MSPVGKTSVENSKNPGQHKLSGINRLLYYIRDQSDLTCTLYSYGQCSLMLSAVPGNSSRKDLSTLGNVLPYKICILIIDYLIRICTEYTYFLTSAHRSSSHGSRILLLCLIVRHNVPPILLKGQVVFDTFRNAHEVIRAGILRCR